MEGTPPSPGVPPVKTWVSVAQDKQVLKKYDVEIRNHEGFQSVEIPDAVVDNATPL